MKKTRKRKKILLRYWQNAVKSNKSLKIKRINVLVSKLVKQGVSSILVDKNKKARNSKRLIFKKDPRKVRVQQLTKLGVRKSKEDQKMYL